ncbi:ATP-binding protein [Streptomyces katsurahamanus]|nr:ATP-binding protein [Streptomyces katsurahamanus]
MPTTTTRPDEGTRRHPGTVALDRQPITNGFDMRLSRTALPGEPIAQHDRAWPALMRRLGAAQLRVWRLDALIESADLVISELVTNGFQHGRGDTVAVRLWRTATYICIEVDSGPSPWTPRTRQPDPYDEGGRGLHLVAALSDTWGITPDGSRTWSVLAAPDENRLS